MATSNPTESSTKARKKAPQRRLLRGLRVDEGFTQHPFDKEFGVRTSGLVAGRDLKSGHANDRHATAYFGVAPSVERDLIARWRRTKPAAELDQTTFIDLGAGMGRAMLVASCFRFRAVVGVELHPTLARIGRRNIALWRAAGLEQAPMKMHCRDAVEFALPEGPCVVFLFNPFAATVMKRLLERWGNTLKGREGQIDLLYVNHEQVLTIRCQPGWTRLWTGEVHRSRADMAADLEILNAQPDGEYAAVPWEDCSIFRWTGEAREN